MEDTDDLAQIRQARLAQLKESNSSTSVAQEDKQAQESAARSSILSQILTPESLDRLNRIRLVKESRARDIEDRLIMLARSGQLRQKVTEEQLKDLLGSLREGKEGERIVVSTRGRRWDEEEDEL